MSMKFEIGTPDSTPETVDYLAVAKANWNAVPGFDGGPDHFMAGAQTCAAISQAESLARIADALEAQQAFMLARGGDAGLTVGRALNHIADSEVRP